MIEQTKLVFGVFYYNNNNYVSVGEYPGFYFPAYHARYGVGFVCVCVSQRPSVHVRVGLSLVNLYYDVCLAGLR